MFMSNVTSSSSGAKPPPAGTTGKGTCGDTTWGTDCNGQPKGAWNTTDHNISSLEACVAKAAACAMGNYASFSRVNEDCSWYQRCDMAHLDVVGRNYTSEVIHPWIPSPAADGAAMLYAMPYSKNGGAKGILLVSKVPNFISLTMDGVSGGVATVVEVTPGDDETALNPPITKIIGSDGKLALGPFAVAVVTSLSVA